MVKEIPSSLELAEVLEYLASFAVSEAGQKKCLSMSPFSFLELTKELTLYEEGLIWLNSTGFKLKSFPFLDDFFKSLSSPSFVLEFEDLWSIRQVLGQIKQLYELINSKNSIDLCNNFLEYCLNTPFPEKSISAFFRCLNEDGYFKDEASPELSFIRRELNKIHQQCIKKVKDFTNHYNISSCLQDEFMALSSDRYVLPLKVQYKNKFQGVIHDYSQTGDTCYFEPIFLVELNNQVQDLKNQEKIAERELIKFLSSLVKDELEHFKFSYNLLVKIDTIQARSSLSACYNGRLVGLDGSYISLKSAIHPILALHFSSVAYDSKNFWLKQQGVDKVSSKISKEPVALDIELNKGQSGLLISGGNAGGKTVTLKTLGLIALMAKCAIPVPVERGSILPWFENIFAFIGDEQSIDGHVSTFTAQIENFVSISNYLNSNCLVILDEFGIGTDPAQGAAIAQSVIEFVLDSGAYIVASTHFPSLKAFALSTDRVRAASVLFDSQTKKPLFKISYDQVGASLALDVAMEHGLPVKIIQRAKQLLLSDEEDTSNLINQLNKVAIAKEKELVELRKEKQLYNERRKALLERFDKEKTQLIEYVTKEAKDVLSNWKQGRISSKQTLKSLSKIRADIQKDDNLEDNSSVSIDISTLEIGTNVFHKVWKKIALVNEIDHKKGRVKLEQDGLFLWSNIEDISLENVSSAKNLTNGLKNSKTNSYKTTTSAASMSMSLDIRGMRAELAREELCRYLDNAVLLGKTHVEVIHGRGTGILRKEVHSVLASFPCVKSFALANEDCGGDGVTLVELK